MFTGIIETIGSLTGIEPEGTNLNFWIETELTPALKIDQSVAHNGVCLTVVAIEGSRYRVTAVEETLRKTSLDAWKQGEKINLERALRIGDRMDGHFVQGHVDTTAVCTDKEIRDGSLAFRFAFPPQFAELLIEKGSVCINGVSLTVFDVGRDTFAVTVIPYTYTHTNFQWLEAGHTVNLEFDVLGKYLLRREEVKGLQYAGAQDR